MLVLGYIPDVWTAAGSLFEMDGFMKFLAQVQSAAREAAQALEKANAQLKKEALRADDMVTQAWSTCGICCKSWFYNSQRVLLMLAACGFSRMQKFTVPVPHEWAVGACHFLGILSCRSMRISMPPPDPAADFLSFRQDEDMPREALKEAAVE